MVKGTPVDYDDLSKSWQQTGLERNFDVVRLWLTKALQTIYEVFGEKQDSFERSTDIVGSGFFVTWLGAFEVGRGLQVEDSDTKPETKTAWI